MVGRPEDIAELRSSLRTGPLGAEDYCDRHGHDVCFHDDRLDLECGAWRALEDARRVLEQVNEVFALRRGSTYRPVALTGVVYEGMSDGSRRVRTIAVAMQGTSGRVTFYAPDPTISVGGVPLPSWDELYLKAMAQEPYFREAIQFAKGSIADVCRAFETIKRRGRPGNKATREGYEYIRDRGWLTPDDLLNLYGTCQPGRHGLPADPVTKGVELSVEQARALVLQLLDRWAEELAR